MSMTGPCTELIEAASFPENSLDQDLAVVRSLGAILVKVWHRKKLGVNKNPKEFKEDGTQIGVLSEKALKGEALSHSVA